MQDNRPLNVIRLLRANALSDLDAFVVGMALFGWAKLSVSGRLSEACAMQRIVDGGLSVLQDTLLSATKEQHDGLLSDLAKLQGMDGTVVLTLVALAYELAVAGELDKLSVGDLLRSDRGAPLAIPSRLVSLMVQLGRLAPNDSVYTPWDFYAQLAIAAHAVGAVASIETPIHSSIPRLFQLLAGASSPVHYADPILAPSQIANGSLIKFDVALSFPPVGLRYEREVSYDGRWNRFAESTTSGSILAIRHLLAQAKRRVVVLVPNSLLSNTGAEAALRYDLLKRGMVEAVIAFPKGLLESTAVATALLILDPNGGHHRVRFLEVDGSRFCTPTSKTRWQLCDPGDLAELATSAQEPSDPCVATVPQADVIDNDATLQVNRYVTARKAANLLGPRPSPGRPVTLGQLVRTVRPLPATTRKDVPASAQPTTLYEIGAADLPEHGYISGAERRISIDGGTLASAAPLFLQPLDIVLIVKGSVGKVGIVPTKVPNPGPGGWIAGQSGIVLRVSDPRSVDPRALFLLLRSPMGQLQLRGIVAGSTTPLIQLRELLALPVQLPSSEEQAAAAEALETEGRIQEQIDQLRALQAKAAAHLWSLEHAYGEGDADDEAPARSGSVQVLSS
ncbi:N-6 DNA methylase [Caldimonas brevitalea]|uniref:site-specific DNA-methyltransferase (adenine-specific) n=1 Tax=Caldimonas brevitalea TaxID=413882 RepID=A0A0G3BJH2_9BURK|nr:N-6 DNA methylase [Caldimonas brevitalea]AKJ26695.1 type I restriction enzyme M protein [Caldimonas brevitalea]